MADEKMEAQMSLSIKHSLQTTARILGFSAHTRAQFLASPVAAAVFTAVWNGWERFDDFSDFDK